MITKPVSLQSKISRWVLVLRSYCEFTNSNWVWLRVNPVLQFFNILKWVWPTKVLILLQDLTIDNSYNN